MPRPRGNFLSGLLVKTVRRKDGNLRKNEKNVRLHISLKVRHFPEASACLVMPVANPPATNQH